MFTKKTALLTTLVLGIALSLSAQVQIRERVFLVEPSILEPTRDRFLEESRLWSNVRPDVSDWYRDVVEGGHGSGFLYVDENGGNYVITNRHVVAHARSADVTMLTETAETTFAACPVVYVSDAADFAVLAFPGGERPFADGFTIFENNLDAGTAVSTAGYPGHENSSKPIWRLTEGSVVDGTSRRRYPQTEEYGYFVRHSAALRGGNSGGPLLTEIDGELMVVGMNTFVSGKEEDGRGYSIPGRVLANEWKEAARTIAESGDPAAQRDLERACRFFASQVSSSVPDRTRINEAISENLVSEIGLEAVEELARGNYEVGEMGITDYFYRFPWNAMRLAALERVLAMLRENLPLLYEGLDTGSFTAGASAPVDGVRTRFRDERASYVITWARSFGKWRITGIDREPTETRRLRRRSD